MKCIWPAKPESCATLPLIPACNTGIRHHNATLQNTAAIDLRIDHMAGATLEEVAQIYSTSVSTAHRVIKRIGRWAD